VIDLMKDYLHLLGNRTPYASRTLCEASHELALLLDRTRGLQTVTIGISPPSVDESQRGERRDPVDG
jgi:hypothetical protein